MREQLLENHNQDRKVKTKKLYPCRGELNCERTKPEGHSTWAAG